MNKDEFTKQVTSKLDQLAKEQHHNKMLSNVEEIPTNQSTQLQQRMEWFTQLPEDEKQKMRDVWQKMNTQERNTLRKRMQNASIEERVLIREEYLSKYAEH